MIRNHWKTNAGKILSLAVLILVTAATSAQIRAQAQTTPKTRMQSTTPAAPGQARTGQRTGTSTASVCLVPRSPECLEVRINELTNRAAALETDLHAIKDLLQRVEEELQKHGDSKGDLAGTITSIWKKLDNLQDQINTLRR